MSWDQRIFDACVKALGKSADKLDPVVPGGMDYVKINVLLFFVFCILLPIALVASLAVKALFLLK